VRYLDQSTYHIEGGNPLESRIYQLDSEKIQYMQIGKSIAKIDAPLKKVLMIYRDSFSQIDKETWLRCFEFAQL
jgi:hypothetical protein